MSVLASDKCERSSPAHPRTRPHVLSLSESPMQYRDTELFYFHLDLLRLCLLRFRQHDTKQAVLKFGSDLVDLNV